MKKKKSLSWLHLELVKTSKYESSIWFLSYLQETGKDTTQWTWHCSPLQKYLSLSNGQPCLRLKSRYKKKSFMTNKPESFTIDVFPFVKFWDLVIPSKSLLVSGPSATKRILDLKSLNPENVHSQMAAPRARTLTVLFNTVCSVPSPKTSACHLFKLKTTHEMV